MTLLTFTRIFLMLFGFLILVYPYVAGYVATRTACSTGSGSCTGCVAMVGSGRFEFVDGLASLDWTRNPGLHRYIAIPIDDKRCESWKQKRNWVTQARLRGVPESKCVIVEPIEHAARYKYERLEGETFGWTGLQLRTIEYRILDTESGSVLGRHRMHTHTPWYAAALFDEKSTWSCEGKTYRYDLFGFIESILISPDVTEPDIL